VEPVYEAYVGHPGSHWNPDSPVEGSPTFLRATLKGDPQHMLRFEYLTAQHESASSRAWRIPSMGCFRFRFRKRYIECLCNNQNKVAVSASKSERPADSYGVVCSAYELLAGLKLAGSILLTHLRPVWSITVARLLGWRDPGSIPRICTLNRLEGKFVCGEPGFPTYTSLLQNHMDIRI
jgi:hypothetical protein